MSAPNNLNFIALLLIRGTCEAPFRLAPGAASHRNAAVDLQTGGLQIGIDRRRARLIHRERVTAKRRRGSTKGGVGLWGPMGVASTPVEPILDSKQSGPVC